MKSNLHLNLIYTNTTYSMSDEKLQSFYRVLFFFSDYGFVEPKLLSSFYHPIEEIKQIADYNSEFNVGYEFLFHTLDDLGQFALDVAKDLKAPEVLMLSNEDYNMGFEACYDLRSFRELFFKYGTIIQNEEQSKRKQLFFWK